MKNKTAQMALVTAVLLLLTMGTIAFMAAKDKEFNIKIGERQIGIIDSYWALHKGKVYVEDSLAASVNDYLTDKNLLDSSVCFSNTNISWIKEHMEYYKKQNPDTKNWNYTYVFNADTTSNRLSGNITADKINIYEHMGSYKINYSGNHSYVFCFECSGARC